MSIVIDTREQLPYSFKSHTLVRKLEAGDYSVAGAEDRIAVERKSMTDFIGTVIRGRKRFHAELRKLAEYEHACVVVEGSLRDLLEGRYPGGAHPNALLGSVLSIVVDFGVPVYFCSDRQCACRFVAGFLERCLKKVNQECRQQQETKPCRCADESTGSFSRAPHSPRDV
ncbi:MAG TPA: ERCC4 domain-containing protein [Candidatus Hydrogenedentes bacterium]|nr:ERCC4 domain-containing protein [Candidatus Hydrogenedentota bacterium]HPG66521.1 ERCC4 domain-containing protein [Candidatus Hydrogenedentota bacterium]